MADNKPKRSLGSILWGIFILLLAGSVYGLLKPQPKPYNPLYKQINEEQRTKTPSRFSELVAAAKNIKIDSGNCSLTTQWLEKAHGVHIEIFYPCNWKELVDNSNTMPTVIKQFNYNLTDSVQFIMSINISNTKMDLTPDVVKNLRRKETLRTMTTDYGTFISYYLIEIAGVKGAVVTNKKIARDESSFIYSISYHFFYNNNIISVSYGVAAILEKQALSLFNKNKGLFDYMVKRTKFL